LLLLSFGLGTISAALHLWTTLTAHLIRAAHFFLLMLSAHLWILAAHTHLLLVLRIHLLLPAHLLLIHGILAVSSVCVASVHLALVSAHVLPVALILVLQLI
jgi:hypothetical protein